jgi:hypothetical protein
MIGVSKTSRYVDMGVRGICKTEIAQGCDHGVRSELEKICRESRRKLRFCGSWRNGC